MSAPTVDMIIGWLEESFVDAGLNLDWYESEDLLGAFRQRLEKGLNDAYVRPLGVGDIVHGFAFGIFGRDHYNCVRVEAVSSDWAVTRQHSNAVEFISGIDNIALAQQARDVDCPNKPNHCLEKDT